MKQWQGAVVWIEVVHPLAKLQQRCSVPTSRGVPRTGHLGPNLAGEGRQLGSDAGVESSHLADHRVHPVVHPVHGRERSVVGGLVRHCPGVGGNVGDGCRLKQADAVGEGANIDLGLPGDPTGCSMRATPHVHGIVWC